MWVVKLGGSLLAFDQLRCWTSALAQSPRPVVVVPGGGVFADQVRAAQRRWGLDDRTAHQMALLAMEQTAQLLCGLNPRLGRLVRLPPLDLASGAQVWFPATTVPADDSIPSTWEVTSDSLAAILARRLGAEGLVLVKSAPLEGIGGEVLGLQAAGMLDGAFDRFGAACGCPVWLLGRRHSGDLARLWEGRSQTAVPVRFPGAAHGCRPSLPTG
jgi:hypothetical protein